MDTTAQASGQQATSDSKTLDFDDCPICQAALKMSPYLPIDWDDFEQEDKD